MDEQDRQMNNILHKPFKFVLIILVVFTIIRIIGAPMSLKMLQRRVSQLPEQYTSH